MTKISELGMCKNECCADKIRAAIKAGTAYGRATTTLSAAMQLPEVRALIEAGDVMANALRGSYIVPGSANTWQAALAPFTETKP